MLHLLLAWFDDCLEVRYGYTSGFRLIDSQKNNGEYIGNSECLLQHDGPDDIVLDGDPAPPTQKGAEPRPQLSAHVHCGQTAG